LQLGLSELLVEFPTLRQHRAKAWATLGAKAWATLGESVGHPGKPEIFLFHRGTGTFSGCGPLPKGEVLSGMNCVSHISEDQQLWIAV